MKSIKGQQMYIQIPKAEGSTSVSIGRLHMIECSKFSSHKVGDRLECKILHVQKEKGTDRTWIELTNKASHLKKATGLCEEEMTKTPLSLEELKSGNVYPAVVVSSSLQKEEAINLKFS